MYKKGLSIILLSALLWGGCSDRPKGILSEDKMVDVMVDLQIAEAYERSGNADNFLHGKNRELLGRGVLMQHGVTVEEMDSTLAWYGRNMDEYSKLYKKIDAQLNKKQIKYAKAAGESENDLFSADLWPYSRHLMINDRSLTDGIIVNFPVSEVAPGDKLTWKMIIEGSPSRTLTLGVDYDNGTSEIYRATNTSYDKWMEVSLQTDSALTVERIFAIAKFPDVSQRILIDSIQLAHTPLKSEDYFKNGFQRTIRPAGRKIILPPDTSANSSGVPDSIIPNPSLSMENRRGVRTRR